jgi:hypothetical protein
MKFEKAKRSKCKMKLCISGASGSGKTYSALKISKGLVGNLSKVVVLDTENGSSNLYADMGEFSVLTIAAPFTPEKYIQAINEAVTAGFECIIIDSLSHEWFGTGGILDTHAKMEGNSFTNWSKITPRHNAMIQHIVNAPVHIIATLRSKTEYVMQQKNGKSIPEKVGMKAIQRDDTDYEFTVAFEINRHHKATVSKDRTGLFHGSSEWMLNEQVGESIKSWCTLDEVNDLSMLQKEILECTDLERVDELIQGNPTLTELLKKDPTHGKITYHESTFGLNGSTHM